MAFKLTILILASITVIFSVVFLYNYFFSRRIIEKNIARNAENLARATVNRIDRVFYPIEKVPENLACFLESFAFGGGDILDLVRSVVEKNPEIYGATIAFEPYAYSPNSRSFAPYFYKSNGKTEFTYLSYEYFFWDWYQIPKELNRPVWTEPYYDEGGGGIIMTTYSVPFYRNIEGKRKLMGVVTADISLTWLQEIVSSIKIGETGYGFLLTKNGTFVTYPGPKMVMNETIFSVAEERGDKSIRDLGRAMIRGNSGFRSFKSIFTGKLCWLVYAPLASNGWSLAVLFPQDELTADISSLNQRVLFISIAGLCFILAVIIWIAGTITRPLRALSRATGEIATGNLDIDLPEITSRDEVGRLTDSFNHMKISLKNYIDKLTETTAAKERIESELKVAHDIQMGILPKTFPPFPEREEFDIFAFLEPAREVGGDLYDFFFMDEDHLCFTVGDVSDKGVPAALFMAVTKTLIKAKTTRGLTPEVVLTRVNQDLSLDNPSMMFVTLFLGILDTRSGEVVYCNGGHNPPYLIRSNGRIHPMESTHGMALGVEESFTYRSGKVTVEGGDTIFLYTDGVTEAMNEKKELFSEKRMEEKLRTLKEKPVESVIAGVMEEVRSFSEGVPQSDDITMMVLRFHGKKHRE
ncbi:MAG: SpoIIE family protein phosphatase [Pseudomonadota bacterium]